MLSLIIPEYIRAYLNALDSGESDAPKNLKNEIKLLLSFQKDKYVRMAITKLEISLEQLIPMDSLDACRDPIIMKYVYGSLKRLFS